MFSVKLHCEVYNVRQNTSSRFRQRILRIILERGDYWFPHRPVPDRTEVLVNGSILYAQKRRMQAVTAPQNVLFSEASATTCRGTPGQREGSSSNGFDMEGSYSIRGFGLARYSTKLDGCPYPLMRDTRLEKSK